MKNYFLTVFESKKGHSGGANLHNTTTTSLL